ncbi:glycosyltransferase family 2 protein [bacterium]|nr:MAG: glycosyltransferase family 2 protein [bacterium]
MISVILPTYNRVNKIKIAVDSILNQTFNNFELIIVDDGSTDNTLEIISDYKDKRINFIRINNNVGACAARNLGWKNAKYSYITFLDSDDKWDINYLQSQFDKFRNCNDKYGLQFCRYRMHKDSKIEVKPREIEDLYDREKTLIELLHRNFISTQTIITRKEVLEKINGFDEKLPAFQDYDLGIRIAENFLFNCNPDILVDVYLSDDSITYKHDQRLYSLKRIYYKNMKYFQTHKELHFNFLYLIIRYNQTNFKKTDLKFFVKLCKVRNHSLKYYFKIIFIFVNMLFLYCENTILT